MPGEGYFTWEERSQGTYDCSMLGMSRGDKEKSGLEGREEESHGMYVIWNEEGASCRAL